MGLGKLFPARESLVSDIPAGDRKSLNLYLQCMYSPVLSPALTTQSSNAAKNITTQHIAAQHNIEKDICQTTKHTTT